MAKEKEATTKKASSAKREITSKDVETEIHTLLRDNQIEFKNKIAEGWKSRMGMMKKVKDYCLIVEVYVKESQADKAMELIKEYFE